MAVEQVADPVVRVAPRFHSSQGSPNARNFFVRYRTSGESRSLSSHPTACNIASEDGG